MAIPRQAIEAISDYVIYCYPVSVALVAVLDCTTMDEISIVRIGIYLFFFVCSLLTSVILWSDKKEIKKLMEQVKHNESKIKIQEVARRWSGIWETMERIGKFPDEADVKANFNKDELLILVNDLKIDSRMYPNICNEYNRSN